MNFEKPTVFITGGAGFIGSNLTHHWLQTTTDSTVTIDKLSYAGNLQNLAKVMNDPRHTFFRTDIGDSLEIARLLATYRPRAIINLAAESHVDRSIEDPDAFIQTNVVATSRLLRTVYAFWNGLDDAEKNRFRFLHISTDEVFGSLTADAQPSAESTRYQPNNPYSASKAASDHLVRSFHRTYGLPTLTINCSNNYGPYQFPEKLIPLAIHRACAGESIPVYGDGQNIRDWLHVFDHCAAILRVLESGQPGESYNVGGSNEKTNLAVIHLICDILDQEMPCNDRSYRKQITFVRDRPGHDLRYAIDSTKIKRDVGWQPTVNFEDGLRQTVLWYLENQEWTANVNTGQYRDWIALQYSGRAVPA